ncbi:MAG: hypothetical protein AAGM46_28410, partial [Cyanobacteria bacterium J06582_2]
LLQTVVEEAVRGVETEGNPNPDRSHRRVQAVRGQKLDVSGWHPSQQKGADDHDSVVSTGMRIGTYDSSDGE